MKPKSKEANQLQELLKQNGTLVPSEGFSLRLMNTVLISCKFSYTKLYRKEERLGKWIIGILAAYSLLIFIELTQSVLVLEMVFPVFSLAIGVLVLIVMLKKIAKFQP